MSKQKKTFWKFFFSGTLWKNLGIAFGIFFLIILLTSIGLRIYTDHGDEIQVPNFTGMELRQVDQMCFNQELKWLIQDSVYLEDLPGGIVIDQYPPTGFKVKKKRKIFLTTNRWYPEMIPMPKAFDMSYRQAKTIIESLGLFIDSLEYEPHFARTYVLKQKFEGEIIEIGTPIQRGSGINLVLGQGLSNETDIIPKLIGLTQDSASSLVMDLHFNIGAVVYDDTTGLSIDSLSPLIYKQFPDQHQKKAQLGSPIDIWLTRDSLKLYMADSTLFELDSLSFLDTVLLN